MEECDCTIDPMRLADLKTLLPKVTLLLVFARAGQVAFYSERGELRRIKLER